MLDITNLNYGYSGKRDVLLKNINLHIARGENVGIVGPNGCGKTTLIKLVQGILKPGSGSIRYKGNRVAWGDQCQGMAYVGDPEFTTENLGLPANRTVGSVIDTLLALNGKTRDTAVNKVFETLKVTHLFEKAIAHLSAGERKRVMLSLLFLQEPELIILDEPFEWLDKEMRPYLMNRLKEFYCSKRTGILLISHNDIEIDHLTDKVYRLENGELREIPQKRFLVKMDAPGSQYEEQKKGVAISNIIDLMEVPGRTDETITIQLKQVI